MNYAVTLLLAAGALITNAVSGQAQIQAPDFSAPALTGEQLQSLGDHAQTPEDDASAGPFNLQDPAAKIREEIWAQDHHTRCMPPKTFVAMAQAEHPATVLIGHHNGDAVGKILRALDIENREELPETDELLILQNGQQAQLMMVGLQHGCVRWRTLLDIATYNDAVWHAVGEPT